MRFERALDISQYHDNDLKNTNILNYIKKKTLPPALWVVVQNSLTCIGCISTHGNADESQSFTPPGVASQAVCGEYKAIPSAKHLETIRSFQFL